MPLGCLAIISGYVFPAATRPATVSDAVVAGVRQLYTPQSPNISPPGATASMKGSPISLHRMMISPSAEDTASVKLEPISPELENLAAMIGRSLFAKVSGCRVSSIIWIKRANPHCRYRRGFPRPSHRFAGTAHGRVRPAKSGRANGRRSSCLPRPLRRIAAKRNFHR